MNYSQSSHPAGSPAVGGDLKADDHKGPLIGTEAVISLIGMSRTWLFKAIRAGNFPSPIRLGARSNLWHEREILEFIESRRVQPVARTRPAAMPLMTRSGGSQSPSVSRNAGARHA